MDTPFQKGPRVTPSPQDPARHKLIQDEIDSMLDKGAIVKVDFHPQEYVSTLFLVEKKTGGQRPVINLKFLNHFMDKIRFKMEGLPAVLNLIQPGDFLTSIDLKDAYFNVPIRTSDRKYLRFIWENQRFQFTCLPFGLRSAPRVFTKVTKPVISEARARGIRTIIYIDDTIIMSRSRSQSIQDSTFLRNLFTQLGFNVNMEKSSFTPSQELEFLGFVLNTRSMKIFLSQRKIDSILHDIAALISMPQPTVRQVAQVIGSLVSTFPAVGLGPMFYRALEVGKTAALFRRGSYKDPCPLSQDMRDELLWWRENLLSHNGKNIRNPPVDLTITSDASKAGWGATSNGHTANGQWSPRETEEHINLLELLGAFFGLKALASNQTEVHILLEMDNSTAVAYVNHMGGTHSHKLNSLAKEIWHWALARKIHLSATHIPGRSNCLADELSRQFSDRTEWRLHENVFNQLTRIFHKPLIDLFASRLNTQLPKFISWQPDPRAWRVQALRIRWTHLQAYAFPPFNLLNRIVEKIMVDRAQILLVTPAWRSQAWFPSLLLLTVAPPVLIRKGHNLLTLVHKPGVLHPLHETLDLIAWNVSGDLSDGEAFRRGLRASSQNHAHRERQNNTRLDGRDGWAGVAEGVKIPFQPLWSA